ncbi:hypothetical protein BC938DRAFT_472074 [Jimgerdemannia flammicorona]|uniref:Uncharacterized protein n=1 Tax=Jimgerdemannia flammicorona TaxID=994334 RepID=A0A433QU76_9FUNG|nr:hypothetical protein BC938DRAFT_472074 [Jimgerdemannia flammicorona]
MHRISSDAPAHNDGQPVADAHTQENNSHTTPSPATPRFTPLPQLPEDEYATSQPQSTPSPSANSSRASVRRSRSIDPVTLHIIKRTSLRMTQKQMAEVIVPVVTEEDAGIDEMGSEEAARASVDSGNANGYAGVQLNNDSGLSTGGLASGVLSTESLPGSRRGSVGSHLSGNAGEGSAEEKDGPEKDKGQRQKRSILSLMKFGRKRGATTVTPAPASDKLAPNTDEAEAAEEMRDSDELNGTVASASTLSVEHDLLPTATNISLASTASSGTVGGSPHTARYVKVKTKHKSAKSFPRLLLAQTLDTAALSAASGTSFSATSQSTASAPISTSPILSPATASTPQTTLAGSDAADPSLPLQGAIWTIKFSRDGKYLASGGQDFVVRVWAVFGTDVTPVAEKKDAGTGLASSGPEATTPDEMERDAKVFRDKPVHEYRGHTADVLDLSWSKLFEFCVRKAGCASNPRQFDVRALTTGCNRCAFFIGARTTFSYQARWIKLLGTRLSLYRSSLILICDHLGSPNIPVP